MTKDSLIAYQYQLLRYTPNLVSGEYYNIGVFLYDQAGRMIDARFTPDFRRLRCNPMTDFEYLSGLRNEFEDRRLLGEGFSSYVEELQQNLSNSLQISEKTAFWGAEAGLEIERLYRTYVATPSPEEVRAEAGEPAAGTRRALRRRMEETFRRYHLFANGDRLASELSVRYGGPRLQFTFDYGYRPNGVVKYVHGLALRNDLNDAAKLCFVFERLRAKGTSEVALTAVVDDQVPADTRELLSSSDIVTWEASRLDELAMQIRGELRL